MEGKVEVLMKQWELAKEDLTKEEINKLLIAQDNDGRTVFHEAVMYDKKEVFPGILNLAKENLTKEEVNKLLIVQDNEGRTVFHVAVIFYKKRYFREY
jgi:ankyrin repeat protein